MRNEIRGGENSKGKKWETKNGQRKVNSLDCVLAYSLKGDDSFSPNALSRHEQKLFTFCSEVLSSVDD